MTTFATSPPLNVKFIEKDQGGEYTISRTWLLWLQAVGDDLEKIQFIPTDRDNNNDNLTLGVNSFGSSSSSGNIAIGKDTQTARTSGNFNISIGNSSLEDDIDGSYNVAIGHAALANLFTSAVTSPPDGSTAVGHNALSGATSGEFNTALGRSAGDVLTTGFGNTAIGYGACSSVSGQSSTTGDNLTCLGYQAKPSSTSVDNEITLGNGDITTLRCNVTTITALSDKRDKTNIEDLPWGIDFVNKLSPVKFDWDRRDGSFKGKKDVGFIAQDLDSVEQDFGSEEYTGLVLRENLNKLEASPGKLIPVLVKAIQELSEEVSELRSRVDGNQNKG